MKKYDLRFSDDGTLVSPNVHDGALTGIVIEPNDAVKMYIEMESGGKICIYMSGVERLAVNNFKEGNIILDITIDPEGLIAQDVISEYMIQPSDDLLAKLQRKFRDEKLITIRLNPSYGCKLLCVCRRVSICEKVFETA